MKLPEQIYMASRFAEKRWDHAFLIWMIEDYYNEDSPKETADEIWSFVEEYRQLGSVAFREKYKEHTLYPHQY